MIVLFEDARAFLLELHPTSNELLYHTHALTSVLSVSDRLADAYCMLPIYKKAIDENAIVYDVLQAGDGKRWTKESAMCKLSCSDTAMFVTNECVQMCGGIGYMRDFPVEKFMRDAKITQIYEGTNQIQRNEIAAMMIKELASATKVEAVAA